MKSYRHIRKPRKTLPNEKELRTNPRAKEREKPKAKEKEKTEQGLSKYHVSLN